MIISCPSCGAGFNIKLEALGSSGRKVKCGKCAHLWHALPDGSTAVRRTAHLAAPAPPPPPPPPEAEPPAAAERAATDLAARNADDDMPLPDALTKAPVPAPSTKEPAPAAKAEPEATTESVVAPPALNDADIEEEPLPEPEVPIVPGMVSTGGTNEADASLPPERGGDTPGPASAPGKIAGPAGRSLARRITLSALAAAAAVIILVGGAIFLQPQITSMVPAAASLYARMGLQMDIPGLGLKIVEPVPRKLVEGDDEILEVVGEIRNETRNSLQIPVMQARLLDGDGEPLEVWYFRAAKPRIGPGEAVQYKTEFRNPPSLAERLDITFTRQESAATGRPDVARKRPLRQEKPNSER